MKCTTNIIFIHINHSFIWHWKDEVNTVMRYLDETHNYYKTHLEFLENIKKKEYIMNIFTSAVLKNDNQLIKTYQLLQCFLKKYLYLVFKIIAVQALE